MTFRPEVLNVWLGGQSEATKAALLTAGIKEFSFIPGTGTLTANSDVLHDKQYVGRMVVHATQVTQSVTLKSYCTNFLQQNISSA